MAQKMKHTLGERTNIRFNRKLKLEFHGARLTSDGGLLAYRELDEALGLFNSASDVISDKRTGRNIQHNMTNLLRQSVYSRLAGYEDVNDAQRLSIDPVMRAVTGKKKNAACINTIGRFETEILTPPLFVLKLCFLCYTCLQCDNPLKKKIFHRTKGAPPETSIKEVLWL